jgi:hypothetical protein
MPVFGQLVNIIHGMFIHDSNNVTSGMLGKNYLNVSEKFELFEDKLMDHQFSC